MTGRELYRKFSQGRSANTIHGTPKDVADIMEEWFLGGVADGFMMFFPLVSGMCDFGTKIVSELQRRGLFRTEYEGTTLRDHLGLKRPPFRTHP
ncbi:hypothetical protein [Rhizorhabdus argentea]|uniref:hypothetical protein n=1 Tax=Rhizorhabdus argentea TaxID=1387174 RepID=UPI0030ED5D10